MPPRVISCLAFFFFLLALVSFVTVSFAQGSAGSLRGRVRDELGGLIVGASVTAIDANGAERTARTNERGEFVLNNLEPGLYLLRVRASGFAEYENGSLKVVAGAQTLDIQLRVELKKEEVAVGSPEQLSTDAENNRSATIWRGAELDALPDDPDDLLGALQALAGPAAGPQGGQILIDGFMNTGQPLPPRATIREIRINQNPFSAENDRLGFGQIQIFTRPGTDRFRGEAVLGFSDESLNSRNPFAQNRAPYQARQYSLNLSGPAVRNRATIVFNFERRKTDDNVVVNATVLDEALNIVPLTLALTTPQSRMNFSTRLDYQPGKNQNLTARYSIFRFDNARANVGGFFLPEAAYRITNTIQTFQATETAIISESLLNEFRAQYIYENQVEYGDSSNPTVNVLGAFSGGGTGIGHESNPEGRLWLQDNVTWTRGVHTLRFGARLRVTTIKDISTFNFGGAYTFAGGLAPQLDANNEVVRDANGQVVLVPITSIERYRRTLLLKRQGLTAAEVRARGGGATQFSITGGEAKTLGRQLDFGSFIQDEWRVRQHLSISLGLRHESQTNITNGLNLAPRISFAWAPFAARNSKEPQTILRGGFGLFYDRFNENIVVTAARFNGGTQRQFVLSDVGVLDLFPAVPAFETVAANSQLPTLVRRISESLRVPYMIQSALSLERQLPFKTTLTLTYINSRTRRAFRSRNVNAPLPGTFNPDAPGSGIRPNQSAGNIFQFESGGRVSQNQLLVAVNNRFSDHFSFFVNYTLSKTMSDTEGLGTFPANSYDTSGEYGRASSDARHSFSLGGNFNARFGLRLNPLVIASSGRPFNIIIGRDANGDTLYTERPAFATDLTKPGVVVTRFGAFDTNPVAGQQIIPRNFGQGPAFFVVNLNVSRAFTFGPVQGKAQSASGAGAKAEKRYSLTFTLRVQNLFNRTNAGQPVGNLSSQLFGQSVSSAGSFGFGGTSPSAGNRRLETQLRFTF
ncbi:MAG: carboxypeptidase regulatory-like domain-containing protein [Pyrinomonadaceae bacterium]|nr:carboxypeptidase regulatory-like domain-containing protein [Pyrinomonadaceae bacterium]